MSDFTIISGDSHIQPIDVVYEDGSPVDLTVMNVDYIWHFAEWEGGEALLTKTKADGITIDPQVNNRALVRIDTGDIVVPFPGEYYHSLEVIIAGIRRTVKSGSVTVRPQITPAA